MFFETVRFGEVEKYLGKRDILIVDVRDSNEYIMGHIPEAVNIPFDELEYDLSIYNGYDTIVLYCDRGNLSMRAARDLSKYGYPVVNLYGGLRVYRGKLVK